MTLLWNDISETSTRKPRLAGNESSRAWWAQYKDCLTLVELTRARIAGILVPLLWNQKLKGCEMHGTLDIRRNSGLGSGVDVYQVRYEDLAGNSFTGSMNNDDLHELLYHKLALPLTDSELETDFARLVREGHLRFEEIELKASELAGAGLRYFEPEA